MALERVPADIRKDGGVARMSDPSMIVKIKKAVTIPVMAKARGAASETRGTRATCRAVLARRAAPAAPRARAAAR